MTRIVGILVLLSVLAARLPQRSAASHASQLPIAEGRPNHQLGHPPRDRLNAPIRFSVKVPQRFVMSTFEYRTGPSMLLDLYQPASPVSCGVVILVHGTAPATSLQGPKDWGFFRSYGAVLAQSGLTTAVPNHRLGTNPPHPEQADEDLRAALMFLRQRIAARSCPGAGEGEFVFFSGAGVLASSVLRGSLGPVRGLALMYPTLDARLLPNYAEVPARERYAAAEVLKAPTFSRFPVFIARGGQDRQPGVNESVDAFLREAVLANLDLTFVNVSRGEHGFENAGSNPLVPAAIEALINFLRRNLDTETL